MWWRLVLSCQPEGVGNAEITRNCKVREWSQTPGNHKAQEGAFGEK
jgi:hypothetical protein